ncbi:MAG: hypothetical protein NTZ42_00610 [Candidatus Gribaldobacteria bacterium]|nr:hypothetical protein [Candidatus Gribaldobacteria bacterium]
MQNKNQKISQLQSIGDFYYNLGYKGDKLSDTLKKDKIYQELLKAKKQKITKSFKISASDKMKFVLSTDTDLEILSQCNALIKEKLLKSDRELVELIKSQLLDDWRAPLLEKCQSLTIKYLR